MLLYDKIIKYVLDNNITSINIVFNYITTYMFNHIYTYCNKNFKGTENLTRELQNQVIKTYSNSQYNYDVVIVSNVTESAAARDVITYNYKVKINNDKYFIVLSDMMDKTYGIEIKYLYKDTLNKNTIDNFNNLIHDFLLITNQTTFLYTQETLLSLKKDLEKINTVNSPAHFLYNPSLPLIASIKAKGKKCLLVIHKTGIWLVNRYYNLIVEPTQTSHNLLYSWHMTVFDGLLIKPLQKDQFNFNYKYWFLCHNCYSFRSKNLRNVEYNDAIDYAKVFFNVVTHYIDNSYLTFSLQTILYSDSADLLHENVGKLLTLSKTINYKHSGLMFKAPTMNYKWQPLTDITIDFLVYPTHAPHVYKFYILNDNKEVVFKGNKKYPFDSSMINHESLDLVYNGTKCVIACKWVNNQFINVKVRYDKDVPDDITIVNDYWNFINNNVSKKDIKGETIYFANQYIKQVKKELKNNYKYKLFDTYWRNEEELDNIVNDIVTTLKLGDRAVFLLLSSEAVNHALGSYNSMTLNDVTIVKNTDSFNINNIEVPMISLNDLTKKLKLHYIELKQFEHLTSSHISTISNVYTSLYVSGYYQKMHL
jgi:hypothetical protein